MRPRSINDTARMPLAATALVAALWLAAPARADSFFFSAGDPDGLLGALSRPAAGNAVETEAADDFFLTETTSIAAATVTGLIPAGASLKSIRNVEVEIYRVFPKDSADPPSGHVPARNNSPSDVEIGDATRDANAGTLEFQASLADGAFSVANSVVDGINPAPDNMTLGDGPASGQAVEIAIAFDPPIVLEPDHYFFRPEIRLSGGADFLFLSAPKPISGSGTPFTGDLQAWIRNSDLKPDWLRIGTDIIGGDPVRTFNMAFSLSGETVSGNPTPTPDPPGGNDSGACAIDPSQPGGVRIPWMLLGIAARLGWARLRRR
jgi:hypothetical protein